LADTNWLDSFRHHFDGLIDGEIRDKVLESWERVGEFSKEELSHWLKGIIERLNALVDMFDFTVASGYNLHQCIHGSHSHVLSVVKHAKMQI
jgi:hypothetical protein